MSVHMFAQMYGYISIFECERVSEIHSVGAFFAGAHRHVECTNAQTFHTPVASKGVSLSLSLSLSPSLSWCHRCVFMCTQLKLY